METAVIISNHWITYLEDFWEEARAYLLTEEVVNTRKAGHGAS